MTTKSTASAVEMPTIDKLPTTISLFGNGGEVWNELMVHVRNGYVITPGTFPVSFQDGNVSVALRIGTPEALVLRRAADTVQRELRAEEDRFNQRVREEVKRQAELQAEAELEQRVAKAEAEAEAAIAKIRRDAAAERARLQAK